MRLARQGGGAEAESHLREAIRLSSGFRSDVHLALGAWLAEHGRLEEAQREYARVLEKEHELYAQALAAVASGRVSMDGADMTIAKID